jgi:hypothetical protein
MQKERVRRCHDLPEAGAQGEPRGADRFRRERCGCIALRSVSAINNFGCLAALEELD